MRGLVYLDRVCAQILCVSTSVPVPQCLCRVYRLLTLVPSTTRRLKFLLLLFEMITFCTFQRQLLSCDVEFPEAILGHAVFPPFSPLVGPVQVPPENLSPPSPTTHCKQLCFTYCSRNGGGRLVKCPEISHSCLARALIPRD